MFSANGDYIVTDWEYSQILVFSGSSGQLLRQFGGKGDTDGLFEDAMALAVYDGRLYVLDKCSDRVQVFE